MALRIRGRGKEPIVIGFPCTLEFTDEAGKVAAVVVQSPGSVSILTPGSQEFVNYCRAHHLTAAAVHVHEDRDNPPR